MPETFSLHQLNERIKDVMAVSFSQPVWIRAEVSEIRENANGHCYLELVEKDGQSDRIIAKNKAIVWSFTYRILKPYFEGATGQSLHEGLQILVACSVEYHELYGLSLNISDIDPTYTLGEMALRRQEILRRLQEEGIADMNKELKLPVLPQRIAVISSETAAGYGDFLDQLNYNNFGYRFYTHLFPAIMQGDRAEQSLIAALDKIYDCIGQFDVVTIIRGGGASADLTCFDRYSSAAHCAQFPLPVLTGIGHQRDATIIDSVAYASLKTPTAVAEFLIGKMQDAHGLLMEATDRFTDLIDEIQERKAKQLNDRTRRLPQLLLGRTGNGKLLLERYKTRLNNQYTGIINRQKQRIEQKKLQLQYVNPLTLLEKGYTLTYKNGKRVTSTSELHPGDRLTTAFSDGSAESIVTKEKTL
jgi:exodeoxyribonuclease VII large subunit